MVHSGIEGNEKADQEAKNAITISVEKLLLTSEDAVVHLKKMSNNISKPHTQKDKAGCWSR
jgi:hypothetical protein